MEVFFSIAILVRKNPHLLPLTLRSLTAQTESKYEVVLIDALEKKQVREVVKQFPLKAQVLEGEGPDGALMNQAVERARGGYIQFLYPGDRYISQQALSYLSELIRDSKQPELVYCAFLERVADRPPQAISFPLNRQSLRQGIFPTMYRSSWFSREAILRLGGFNGRLSYRPSYDLLCRLFEKPEMKAVYSRRVLTDYEPSRHTPRALTGYALETCKILYRYFGLRATFRWLFIQDPAKILRSILQLLKEAFSERVR